MDGGAPQVNVFVSHAGEDNDRFARDFAERLQSQGFRVWFDEWELFPGDSLVDRVFEEGVKNADAMVVILSKNSVDKPWVREELNAGFVQRLEGRCRLIPVVIDEVDVPEALKSTVWQRVRDLESYVVEFDRIARAIRGDRNRRDPGHAPAYVSVAALPGLYSADTRLLQVAGDIALETDGQLVDTETVLTRTQTDGISEEALLESLQILEEHGYVDIVRTMSTGISGMLAFTITLHGMEEYARTFIPDYDTIVERVVVQLVNGSGRDTDSGIADEVGTTRLLAEHVLDVLAARGLIQSTKMTGPTTLVTNVSPQLGRILQDGG